MIHAHTFISRNPPPPASDWPADPLTPAAYIKLRRTAAGMTIDQVAERLAGLGKRGSTAAQQSDARALLRLLETPRTVARKIETIELLTCAFPIDPDVYRQLATEPADRHPSICRGCGCSQHDPCGGGMNDIGACGWAMRDLCTRCSDGEVM